MKIASLISVVCISLVSFTSQPEPYFRCKKISVNNTVIEPEVDKDHVSYDYHVRESDKGKYKSFGKKEMKEEFLEGINVPIVVGFETNGYFVLDKVTIECDGDASLHDNQIVIKPLDDKKMRVTILRLDDRNECSLQHNLSISLNLKIGKSIEPYFKNNKVEANPDIVKVTFSVYDKELGKEHEREITQCILINKIPPE